MIWNIGWLMIKIYQQLYILIIKHIYDIIYTIKIESWSFSYLFVDLSFKYWFPFCFSQRNLKKVVPCAGPIKRFVPNPNPNDIIIVFDTVLAIPHKLHPLMDYLLISIMIISYKIFWRRGWIPFKISRCRNGLIICKYQISWYLICRASWEWKDWKDVSIWW